MQGYVVQVLHGQQGHPRVVQDSMLHTFDMQYINYCRQVNFYIFEVKNVGIFLHLSNDHMEEKPATNNNNCKESSILEEFSFFIPVALNVNTQPILQCCDGVEDRVDGRMLLSKL